MHLKQKSTATLVTSFFKSLTSDAQTKVTNADTTTNYSETACYENLCVSDSSCSEGSASESEPEASQVSPSESIETQRSLNHHNVQTHPSNTQGK